MPKKINGFGKVHLECGKVNLKFLPAFIKDYSRLSILNEQLRAENEMLREVVRRFGLEWHANEAEAKRLRKKSVGKINLELPHKD